MQKCASGASEGTSISSSVGTLSFFFFSSRRRHTRLQGDWSSDVCSSDLLEVSRYYPIGRRGAFAWRLLGGTILPARQISLAGQSVRFVPPDQRFYGGGPNSVRGYARNELGPRVYVRPIQVDSTRPDTGFGNLQASATR